MTIGREGLEGELTQEEREFDIIDERVRKLGYNNRNRIENEIFRVYDAIHKEGEETYQINGVEVNANRYLEYLRDVLEDMSPKFIMASSDPKFFYGRRSNPRKNVILPALTFHQAFGYRRKKREKP